MINSRRVKVALPKDRKGRLLSLSVKMNSFSCALKTNKEKGICQINSLYKVLGIVLILASKYITSGIAAAIVVTSYLNL